MGQQLKQGLAPRYLDKPSVYLWVARGADRHVGTALGWGSVRPSSLGKITAEMGNHQLVTESCPLPVSGSSWC